MNKATVGTSLLSRWTAEPLPAILPNLNFLGTARAFTGAYGDRCGLFQTADRGTLFLDEIGNLSPETQMLLLRALQERRYKPVGSTREYAFDVRLVAATNENLERAISEGRFREDLFHRLNEFTINVPPLGMREDILPLAEFFMKHFSEKHRKPIRGFNSLAAVSLQKYPWPGNIRELKNCIQRAVLLSADGWISLEGAESGPHCWTGGNRFSLRRGERKTSASQDP